MLATHFVAHRYLVGHYTAHSPDDRLRSHLDLPKAATPSWTGLTDPTSQFDLERARKGGLTAAAIAVFVPQGSRDAASLANARRDALAKDGAIHAIADRNPNRAEFARSPPDVRRIVASGKFAVVESLLNAWPLGDDLDAFDRWHARGVSIASFVHAGQTSSPTLPAPQFNWTILRRSMAVSRR